MFFSSNSDMPATTASTLLTPIAKWCMSECPFNNRFTETQCENFLSHVLVALLTITLYHFICKSSSKASSSSSSSSKPTEKSCAPEYTASTSTASTPANTDPTQNDLFCNMKSLSQQLELIDIQEEYIKDEMRNLKRELSRAKEEIKRIQSVPLVIGQFNEVIDANYGIVGSTAGSNYYVRILSTIDRELLKPNTSVALHRHSHSVVDILPPESDSTVQIMAEKVSERSLGGLRGLRGSRKTRKREYGPQLTNIILNSQFFLRSAQPDVSYKDIGGMDVQKQEVREAIELPLLQHHLYTQIGIDPPRGVLLYGPPGTGKTMMAKAVANATSATFISMVGSEFVQKYLGEGPRMVRDVFR